MMDMTIARKPVPSLTSPLPQVINLLLFQVVWIVTVLSVDLDIAWAGPVILSAFVLVNSIISATVQLDLILASIAVAIGLAIDTIFIQSGILSFNMNLPWPGIAPFWTLVLWANFALILNNGLRWLHGRYASAALFGFLGGPLSYLAGIRLGAGELHASPLWAFLIIGLCWSIVTPLLLATADKLADKAPSR